MQKRAGSQTKLPYQLDYEAQSVTMFVNDVEDHLICAKDADACILIIYGVFVVYRFLYRVFVADEVYRTAVPNIAADGRCMLPQPGGCVLPSRE